MRRLSCCSVKGCGRRVVGRGLCSAHWQRFKRHGQVFPERPISKALNHQGDKNGRWTGGQISDGHGRVLIYSPGHPYPNWCKTHVYRYRLVMEKHLGRHLLPKEIVHHKNNKFDDDRLENLEIMSQSDHMKGHLPEMLSARKAKWNGKWSMRFRACKQCSTINRKHFGNGLCSRCYKRNRKTR